MELFSFPKLAVRAADQAVIQRPNGPLRRELKVISLEIFDAFAYSSMLRYTLV